MIRPSFKLVCLMALVGVLVATLSCVDTERVLVDRPLYQEPPNGAQGFLGYSDQEAHLPVCGNCHVGHNAGWQETRHAHAWQDLQDSGHATEECEACHTVGANGNFVTDTNVGWTATGDPRYQDVQCEACHGPGLEHVTNPDATQPLASIKVGVNLESGCGECHQGVHNPFVEEWSQSRHANTSNHAISNEACQGCHEGKGALAAFGVTSNYLEKGTDELIPITCPVCHDPHDATNEGQLRFPIDVPDLNQNLCMKCHQRRAAPDPTSSRNEPHSPQGPLLLGEDVGWRPPNFQYDNGEIVGTHGTERNPRLCATCHVSRLEVTDATGSFVFNASGHLFKPIPCLDDQGVPTANDDCTLDQRSFASCTNGPCHSEAGARSAYIAATTRIKDLVEELDALLEEVPASEFDDPTVYTTAEGAQFNAELGAITSSAIHNPFLTEALLTASIKQVMKDYNLGPVTQVRLDNVLGAGGD